MIDITRGTHEEQIIKILLERYPVTVADVVSELKLSSETVERVLHAFATKGIVMLEPLPDAVYIRLLRRDIRFLGKRRQKKFVKRKTGPKKPGPEKYDGYMFS